jgi:O-antigen ligase
MASAPQGAGFHASRPKSSSKAADRPLGTLFWSTAIFIALALVFGGGAREGRWSDAVVQLASLGILVTLAWTANSLDRILPQDRRLQLLLAGVVLLPLLQLVMLPPFLWSLLPGRALFAATYDEAGIGRPWLPISLDPVATGRAALASIPPLAIFLATLQLGYKERRVLSLLFIALGFCGFLFGLAQLMQGPDSPLRFYASGAGDSVGFFANRNHQATLLVSLLPLSAAWILAFLAQQDRNRILLVAVGLLVFALLLLGVGMTRSRAGLMLAGIAIVASLWMGGSRRDKVPFSRRAMAVAIGLGILLVLHFAFTRLAARFETDLLDDNRFIIAAITAEAAWAYFPVGSGFGTFEAVYRLFEPASALTTFFANHAHNDWLELLLEGGLPAALLLIAGTAWLGITGYRAWRRGSGELHGLDRALRQGASISILVIALHSLVAYPMRTPAISVLFAWCAAMLIDPKPFAERGGEAKAPRREARLSHHRRRRRPAAGWR